MASATAITLTNSVATDKVFNPLSVQPKSSVYINRDSNSAIASEKVTLGFNPSSANRQTDHATIRLDFPWEALVDGKYVVTDKAIFEAKFTIPSSFISLNRDDFLAQVRDLIDESVITDLVSNLEAPY